MTTATAEKSATKATSDNGTVALTPTRNLYQRLAAITGEVGNLTATGRTAFGQKAVSIEDVEDAIRDLCARHGVVTGYRWNSEPKTTGREGNQSLWMADLTVWLVNADQPTDTREELLFDVGTSPSAAVSFAIKRYYKALFHLADESDESRSTPTGRRDDGNGDGHVAVAPTVSLNPDQALEITALNASLPKPYNDTVLAAMSKSGYPNARNALRKAHQQACGEACEHIAKA